VLQKLWYDRPVSTQLLIAVGLINLLAAVVAVSVSILNTRTATRVEIEASLEVAQRFVNATIKDLAAQGHFDQLEQLLQLQLKHVRHVRIMYMDPLGQLTVVSPADESAPTPAPPRSATASARSSASSSG
jgi:two-component system sensor histidine kinase UhpB